MIRFILLLTVALFSCSDSESTPSTSNGSRDAGTDLPIADVSSESDSGTIVPDLAASDGTSAVDMALNEDAGFDFDPNAPFGGDRPAKVVLPTDYDPAGSYPLVTLLHGYTADGDFQDGYFDLSDQVDGRQFILIIPEGFSDTLGNQYWNATPYCCGTGDREADDVAYLMGLVSEAEARYAVNSDAIYFVGHSNGGFMSYTLACEHGDRIAGIASLAGSTFDDPDNCPDTGDVAILQIHGTIDAIVFYGGFAGSYPGAEEVVGRWAERNGCDAGSVAGPDLNLAATLIGDETDVERWVNCNANNADVTLWKINGGSHIPGINDDFTPLMLDHLFSRTR